MYKYRITVTWGNDLTQSFHLRRKERLLFENLNLSDLLKNKETDNVIGLHIREVE